MIRLIQCVLRNHKLNKSVSWLRRKSGTQRYQAKIHRQVWFHENTDRIRAKLICLNFISGTNFWRQYCLREPSVINLEKLFCCTLVTQSINSCHVDKISKFKLACDFQVRCWHTTLRKVGLVTLATDRDILKYTG